MDSQAIADRRFQHEGKLRPSSRRAAARAAVLSTIVCRAPLKKESRQGDTKNAPGGRGRLPHTPIDRQPRRGCTRGGAPHGDPIQSSV